MTVCWLILLDIESETATQSGTPRANNIFRDGSFSPSQKRKTERFLRSPSGSDKSLNGSDKSITSEQARKIDSLKGQYNALFLKCFNILL